MNSVVVCPSIWIEFRLESRRLKGENHQSNSSMEGIHNEVVAPSEILFIHHR
jgi:hypothetical protein